MSRIEVPRGLVSEALNERNYTSWAACMKNYLMGKGLWEIVEGTESEPVPDQKNSEPIKKWRKQNAKALHAIQVSCSSRMFSYIVMKTSAKAAWDCLASIHAWHEHKVVAVQHIAPVNSIEGTSSAAGSSENINISYMSLYKTVISGDWKATEKFLLEHKEAVRAQLSTDGGTALHNAVLHEQENLVEQLVNFMNAEELKARRTSRDEATALHIAATGSKVKMAKAMVEKNKELLSLPNSDGYIPVCIAALYGDKDMLYYLYSETPSEELDPKRKNTGATLLSIAVSVENYDFALELLDRFPELATTKDDNGRICLNILAQKLSSFPSGSQLSTCQRWMYNRLDSNVELSNLHTRGDNINPNEKSETFKSYIENPKENSGDLSSRDIEGLTTRLLRKCFDETYKLKIKHGQAREILKRTCIQLEKSDSAQHLESLVMPAMLQAAEAGNIDFINEMIKSYPTLQQAGTQLGGIFHIAVAQRRVTIWYSIPGDLRNYVASIKDEFNNNILHMAAILAPESHLQTINGPAMQMQRELGWFKAVQDAVPPMLREQQNREGKTPETLFSEQHSHLVIEGRKWLKDTATSCMLVAALIATVMFEGANDTETWDDKIEFYWYSFHIYMIANALSLLSSTISVLTFLSIFTSRYAAEDFLDYLPNRLLFGMFTLFFSIGTMMLAFGVLFFVNLNQSHWWRALGFSSVAMVPVILFASLHFPLLLEMIRYSYRPSISICKPKAKRFFYRDPKIRQV